MKSNKWARVSIVTPSYNQGRFLEETIISVLNQDYPNLEYIMIDGGSTDNSVDIIRKYEDRLAYWVSEPDKGQSDAINKGFQRATGEILAWLNSDDIYLPGAIKAAVQFFEQHPDIDFVYGDFCLIDERGRVLFQRKEIDFDYKILLYGCNLISQPTSFFRRTVLDKIGFLDQTLDYLMDYEFWLRASNNGVRFKHIPNTLAAFRLHSTTKTVSERTKQLSEFRLIRDMCRQRKFGNYPLLDWLYTLALKYIFRLKKTLKRVLLRKQISFLDMSFAKMNLKLRQTKEGKRSHEDMPNRRTFRKSR